MTAVQQPTTAASPTDPAAAGAGRSAAEQGLVDAAAALAAATYGAQTLPGGETMVDHARATVALLDEMHLDAQALAAAWLALGAWTAEADRRRLVGAVGPEVAAMVDGVTRMAHIEGLVREPAGQHEAGKGAQLEGLRKMILAMVQDVRVVLIKLASHTQSLRFLVKSGDEAVRAEAARLADDIFAPLANRLGIWQLKWELEDLSLRILEPEVYKRIARLLDEKRVERERFIDDVMSTLRAELAAAGIRGEVRGRPKHIYSIWKKMRRKDVGFEELYDISAVRVMVDDVRTCYAVLGLVHNRWTPIPKEFDDYIAKPKGNDYRSLHTAVIGPGGRAVEVQIRTFEMHRQAELGVAAHWRYKEGSKRDAAYDRKVAWLRQVLEWKDELADEGAVRSQLREQLTSDLFGDTVYVLTPQGKVIDLPAGSTPVDFAYHLHSDLGHRCRGARIDGAMVPLNTVLANGQRVEIVTAKQGGPSRDWLNPALGFLKSHRARAKVRQWFNSQNLAESIASGRAVVEKELARFGLTSLGLDRLATALEFDKVDDMFAQAGRGELGPRAIQTALRAFLQPEAPPRPSGPAPAVARPGKSAEKSGILVVGVDRLLTIPAKCCKPAPPDPIVGFVTRGRGVMVHRAGCVNLKGMPAERLITADWGAATSGSFAVDIVIDARDRTGLLRDITEVLSRERINVTATQSLSRDNMARITLTVEVADIAQLKRMLGMIGEVPGIVRAVRR